MSVAMIFPPIINSGFGAYYPALPVLAGYLASNGVPVVQVDLNEELAEYLLRSEALEAAARGDFPRSTVSSLRPETSSHAYDMAATAARLPTENRGKLFDAVGRHRFREREETPAYLLAVLAQAFLVDQPVRETISAITADTGLTHWYREFYLQADLGVRLAHDVSLIGISVPMGPQLFPALILAQILKQVRPGVRIIFGGPALVLCRTPSIEFLLRQQRAVDAIVRLRGGSSALGVGAAVRDRIWAPDKICGASCIVGEAVVHRAPGPGVRLDSLPIAHYDPGLLSRLDDPEFGVVQTRGCYWGQCAYCDFVELYDGSPRYRGRSAASFVDEIEALIRLHGARRFSLITEAIPPSFALKFSRLVVQRGLKIAWSSFAMIDRHFTERHFEAMASSGCEHLVVGLETMTDRVLKLVQKYATGDDNEWFLRQAHEVGIRLVINLIPDLPTTTYEEAIACLRRLEALSDILGGVAVFPFEATHSSQIGRSPQRFGLAVADADGSSGQAAFADNHLQIVDSGMSGEQRSEVHRLYRAFADTINARSFRLDGSEIASRQAGERLKVASADYDLVRAGDRIRVFNWKTRQLWDAPVGYERIIDRAAALGLSFSREELLEGAAEKAPLEILVDQLIEKRIFVSASPVSTEEVAIDPSSRGNVVLLDH